MKKFYLLAGLALMASGKAMGYDFMVDGLAYNKLSDSTVEVTYKGSDYKSGKEYNADSYVIPATVTYEGVAYSVVKIGDSAFYGTPATSITLPESVKIINGSFGSSSLTHIEMPGVEEIEAYSFFPCKNLKEVELPATLKFLPPTAFGTSNVIEKLTLNCNPSAVSGDAFNNSSAFTAIKEVVLGADLTTLGTGAIGYWANGGQILTIAEGPNTLQCEADNIERWTFTTLNINRPVNGLDCSDANIVEVINIADIAPCTVTDFPQAAYSAAKLYVYGKRIAEYKAAAPWSNFATILPVPGTEVADETYGFNFKLNDADGTAELIEAGNVVDPYEGDIVIPSTIVMGGKTYTVTSIGLRAFQARPITSVTFPETLVKIDQLAFWKCTNLKELSFPASLKTIGSSAFSFTSGLKAITIPATIETLGSSAFQNSGIAYAIVEEGITSLGSAFKDCANLVSVSLPSTLTSLGADAFSGCTALTEIELPSSLRELDWNVFSASGITELNIPEGLETLGMMTLGNMNGDYNADYTLKKVVLPASLKSINYKTFNNRRGLKELVFNGDGSALTCDKGSFIPEAHCTLEAITLGRTFSYNGSDITATVLSQATVPTIVFDENMTSIPDLSACSAIRDITIRSAAIPVAGGFSQEVYDNATLHVPNGMAAQYAEAEVWKNFKNIDGGKPVCGIDTEKIRYTVGEGDKLYAVVIDFNNANRLDNLVLGYRTNAETLDLQSALAEIAAADKRLNVADGLASLMFDLDGNDIFDVKDASAVAGTDSIWHLNAEILAADAATPVISVFFAAADATEPDTEAPYYFYLPAPDETGVWLPEEMTVKLADESFVLPVLVQPQGANVTMTTNWQASQSNTSYRQDTKIVGTPYSFVDGSYHARPSLKGATGTTYMRYRPQIDGTYTESNYMTLNVEAPEIPVTAIAFAEAEIVSGLNRVVEYTVIPTPENATYTAVTLTVADKTIATWSATAGLKTAKAEGETTITAAYAYNSNVTADFTLKAQLINPVTAVSFGPGTEEGVINVPVRQLIGLKPIIEPADADIPEVNIVLSDNGTSKDDMTCSTYKVNWWDINNVRSQFFELSGHRPTGDAPAKLTVTSVDGKYTKEFVVNVIEADRTPLEGGYEDGTIVLNEEWFGHTNGGLNYFTEDGEVIYQAYEKENPGMAFGCTSQHGAIWNGKLFVASKQAQDGGDPLPGGGRLVIADAKTLKRLGSLDVLSVAKEDGTTLSGDGRAVCGATADKVYVSTNNGIFVVDVTDPAAPVVTNRIGMGEGEDNTDLYNGQVGDMVNACGHVFAVMQGGGIMIIDVNTDTLNPATITDGNAQGVTQSADGNVWYCTVGRDEDSNLCSVFVAIDPETLQEVDRVMMPASIGTVACGWGAWRSTAFKGSHTGNDLWFVTGAASIMGGASGDYYRYTIGEDPSTIEPFFTLSDKTGINGFGEEVGLMTYGTPLYDPRNNQLIVMAGKKGAASGGYRDHWTLWVNGDNGEIDRIIKLNPYYWFQSLPILPDKYAAEINVADIALNTDDEPLEFDLSELVTDQDNINRNIIVSLETSPMEANALADTDAPAEVTLEGKTLTVKPLAQGSMSFAIKAESNGRQIAKNINVEVIDQQAGISSASRNGSIFFADSRLYINGHCGEVFAIYDINGVELSQFTVDTDNYILDFSRNSGVYIVNGEHGSSLKIIVK